MMIKKGILVDDFSVSYTLKTDDITTADKPPMTPYVSRKEYFDESGYAPETRSILKVWEENSGWRISVKTESDDLSEFGLNIPINFMGKKNAGGWRNQYLFNSPYATKQNNHVFCYLSSPDKKGLLILALNRIDGWKMDYSLFSGGQYFDNLKMLASFDRAYKGSGLKKLELFMCEVTDYRTALRKVSSILKLPVAYYDKSYTEVGKGLKVKIYGDCDLVRFGKDHIMPENGNVTVYPRQVGLAEVIPYFKGKRSLECTIYAYKSINSLWQKSMSAISAEDLSRTDGNMCESKNHISALLKYMQRFGINESWLEKIMPELKLLTTGDINEAKDRQTILPFAYDGYPAYNTMHSNRVQEQFFGVGILLEAYKLLKDRFYLDFAINALDSVLRHHLKEDGRIETKLEWSVRPEDYTTVCCLIIPVIDMAEYIKKINPEKSKYYYNCAAKMAEHVYERDLLFPTETVEQDFAEPFMEEGSISCSALTLLYYCAKVKKIPKYIKRAKKFLDIHDAWIIHTCFGPMFYSSLRWWETKFEADYDGNALCCGHAWTIWRAEADYWYYKLTGDRKYLAKARNGFMSNFSKINARGQSYSCYQPDYITGGGFTVSGRQVEFRIARGFPRHTDSSLSRYAWFRAADIMDDLF